MPKSSAPFNPVPNSRRSKERGGRSKHLSPGDRSKLQDLRLIFEKQANAQNLNLQAQQAKLAAGADRQQVSIAQRLAATHAAEANHKMAIRARQKKQQLKLMWGTTEQKLMHEMRMRELHVQGQNVKTKMLDDYINGKQIKN
jgi:hypothetical protein